MDEKVAAWINYILETLSSESGYREEDRAMASQQFGQMLRNGNIPKEYVASIKEAAAKVIAQSEGKKDRGLQVVEAVCIFSELARGGLVEGKDVDAVIGIGMQAWVPESPHRNIDLRDWCLHACSEAFTGAQMPEARWKMSQTQAEKIFFIAYRELEFSKPEEPTMKNWELKPIGYENDKLRMERAALLCLGKATNMSKSHLPLLLAVVERMYVTRQDEREKECFMAIGNMLKQADFGMEANKFAMDALVWRAKTRMAHRGKPTRRYGEIFSDEMGEIAMIRDAADAANLPKQHKEALLMRVVPEMQLWQYSKSCPSLNEIGEKNAEMRSVHRGLNDHLPKVRAMQRQARQI